MSLITLHDLSDLVFASCACCFTLLVFLRFRYSTCALSEAENDGAGAKKSLATSILLPFFHSKYVNLFAPVDAALVLLSKLNLGGGQVAPEVEVQPGVQDTMGWSMGEATRHGVLILPDTCNGWGPL